jgi:hypothetical protein
MAGTAKTVGVAVVAVLTAVVAGAATQPAATVAAPAVSPTPTASPSATPTSTSRRASSSTITIDMAEGLKKNKLYAAGKVPAVRCKLPKVDMSSRAAMLGYAQAMVACMDKAWAPLIMRANGYFEPPRTFASSTTSATPEWQGDLLRLARVRRLGRLRVERDRLPAAAGSRVRSPRPDVGRHPHDERPGSSGRD